MRTPTLTLLALLATATTTTGCAYHQAMKSAAEHADDGEWQKALADYERALDRRPHSEKAADAADDARPKAVAEALGDAKDALDRGDWEKAVRKVDYAQKQMPDEPMIGDLRGEIERRLHATVDDEVRGGRMDDAYDLLVRAAALFPSASWVTSTTADVRKDFLDRSDKALAKKDYATALADVLAVSSREPSQASAVAPREQKIRDAWAVDLALQAATHEKKGETGAAAALYARAVEVDGRDVDKVQMRRLVEDLESRGAWKVAVRGSGAHGDAVARQISAGLAGISGNAVVRDTKTADLVVDVAGSSSVCRQTATVRYADQPYVAGQRTVPNPAYEAVMEDLHHEREQMTALQAGRDAAEADGARAKDAAARYRHDTLQPRQATLDATKEAADDAQAKVDGAKANVAMVEQKLASMVAANAPQPSIDAVTHELEAARGELGKDQQDLDAALAAVDQARQDRDAAGAEYQRLTDVASDADARRTAAGEEIAAEQARLDDLEVRRARTPETLIEDVTAVFRYEVSDWTRTCADDVDVTASAAGGPATSWTLSYAASTQDTSWESYPRYGVVGDALRFPVDDASLLAQVDGDAAADALARVDARIDALRRDAAAQALARPRRTPTARRRRFWRCGSPIRRRSTRTRGRPSPSTWPGGTGSSASTRSAPKGPWRPEEPAATRSPGGRGAARSRSPRAGRRRTAPLRSPASRGGATTRRRRRRARGRADAAGRTP